MSVIVRNPDYSWTATEWAWTPSPRAATRQWQQGKWDGLSRAAQTMQPPAPAAQPSETALLLAAWEAALSGRAAETDGKLWRWQGDGACIALDNVGLTDAQVQIPYKESEGRLEQRAAMQLLLARRYPGAEWVLPFTLLPQDSADRGGAKYSAIWHLGQQLHGQLWIPKKDDKSIVRVRMTTALPANLTAAQRQPHVARASRAISAEITALAKGWDAKHER